MLYILSLDQKYLLFLAFIYIYILIMCILHTIDAAQVPFALCLNGDESPNTPLIVLSSFLYDGIKDSPDGFKSSNVSQSP